MAKLLFCEDEELIQKLIHYALRKTGHELYFASDGNEGFALIESLRPDLVFTDISMPGCDGFQLADAVKAQPHLASIPIIFMTAFGQKSDREEGTLHGASGYLLKPFSTEELREAAEVALLNNIQKG